MVFSSLIFLYGFLPLCLLCCVLSDGIKRKNAVLLVFSLIFYAWAEPKYVLLLVAMSLFDWFFALRVEAVKSQKQKRLWVILACVVDLGLIGFFKYCGLFWSVFAVPPQWVRDIALPIGISFYTFQLLTYVIDVYRGDAAAQKSFFNVLLYASLFHQCIAGPIVRYKDIATELFEERTPYKTLVPGIRRFTIGLAKKAVLANVCAKIADTILLQDAVLDNAARHADNLAHLTELPVLGVWLGMIAYTLQIYFDFSAYSDMAIGMGKMMGLNFMENFNYPYISRSVREFWSRWHISLSTFFRDYVYIPLGGSRCSPLRNVLNLLIVWMLTGLWHGASWSFVLWGLYYFVFLMLERLFLRKVLEKFHVLSRIYLLLVVVFGWVLFRFTDLELGAAVMRGMLGLNHNALTSAAIASQWKNYMFFLPACVLFCTPVFQAVGRAMHRLSRRSSAWYLIVTAVNDMAVPILLLLISTACLVGESYNPFIYFRF